MAFLGLVPSEAPSVGEQHTPGAHHEARETRTCGFCSSKRRLTISTLRQTFGVAEATAQGEPATRATAIADEAQQRGPVSRRLRMSGGQAEARRHRDRGDWRVRSGLSFLWRRPNPSPAC